MKLETIDLSKAVKHEIPNTDMSGTYLAKIGDRYHLGYFERQWYGLNFRTPEYQSGVQFDAPGWNSSSWQGLWRLIE